MLWSNLVKNPHHQEKIPNCVTHHFVISPTHGTRKMSNLLHRVCIDRCLNDDDAIFNQQLLHCIRLFASRDQKCSPFPWRRSFRISKESRMIHLPKSSLPALSFLTPLGIYMINALLQLSLAKREKLRNLIQTRFKNQSNSVRFQPKEYCQKILY